MLRLCFELTAELDIFLAAVVEDLAEEALAGHAGSHLKRGRAGKLVLAGKM